MRRPRSRIRRIIYINIFLIGMICALSACGTEKKEGAEEIVVTDESFHKNLTDIQRGKIAAYLDQYLLEDGLRYIENALKKDTKNDALWNEKANILLMLSKDNDALEAADTGLKICPGNIFLLNNKGDALQNLGNLNEAMQCYERVLRFHPKNKNSLFGMGKCLYKQNNYDEAVEYFKLKIEYEKETSGGGQDESGVNTETQLLLAECYMMQNKNQDAIGVYDTLIDRDAENFELYYLKASALLKMGQYEQVIAVCDAALSKVEGYAEAYYLKSCAYAGLNQKENCFENLRQAVLYGEGLGLAEQATTDGYFEQYVENQTFQNIVVGQIES